jgi:uncharacterized membrane protein
MIAIKPGTHEITMEKEQSWSGPWTGKTTITVEAGKSYFLTLSLLSREVSGVVLAGPVPIVTREQVSQGQRWDQLSESTGRQLIVIHDFVDPFVKILE